MEVFNNFKSVLVADNKGFKIYFNPLEQEYTVIKDDKFLMCKKHRWVDVKAYIL
jgi:hypothetical protein